MAFKNNDPHAIAGAISVFSRALHLIDFGYKYIAFTPALHSGDVKCDTNSNTTQLCAGLAEKFKVQCLTNILAKGRHKKLHTITKGVERDAEVAGKYECSSQMNFDCVFVFDDFTTRGATITEIARAIKHNNRKTDIIGVVLGKNENRGFAAHNDVSVSNDHLPNRWLNLWDRQL